MAASDEIECMVTPEGLQARADGYGVPLGQLPPPDGMLAAGDTYSSSSGCAKGDYVVETGASGTPQPATADTGTSPVVIGTIVVLVLIIAAAIAYFVARRTAQMRLEREAFLEAELRQDRDRGRF